MLGKPMPCGLSSDVIRLILIEDDRNFRLSLVSALHGKEGMEVSGAYATAEAALAEAKWRQAEILLVDLELPGMSGVELIRTVHASHPHVGIIVHTIHDHRELVFRAIEAGATGYLLKGQAPAEMAQQLRDFRKGLAPVSPSIAMLLLRALGPTGMKPQADPLSAREIQLLRLIAEGCRYKEVAEKLGISPHTVNTHVKHIYHKLQAGGRNEAIRGARLRGLL